MSFSVINALIANKNNQIVVDYSAYHGNFQQIELMILKKINNSTIGEIKYNNQYKFYFEKENEITYMCLVKENESLPHTESLYTLLYDLKHKFLDKYKNENIQNSSAFKYQTFSHEIKPIVDFYNENDDYVKERVVQKLKRRIILNTTIDEYIDSIYNMGDSLDNAILFFIDVDYLKSINDNYGHNAGDEIIVATARCMKETFKNHVCYRIGGDEFCGIVINSKYDADHYLNILDEQVNIFNKQSTRLKLSLSKGYSILKNDDGSYKTISDWKQNADMNMYKDKAGKIR